jgi:tetratricopeptide (TPR) repeat protein
MASSKRASSSKEPLKGPAELIPSLISEGNTPGVALALETWWSTLELPLLRDACLHLARAKLTTSITDAVLSRLQTEYPVEAVSLRCLVLVQDGTTDDHDDRCRQAIDLIRSAAQDDMNPVLNYNLALLYARLRRRKKAFKYVKKSIFSDIEGKPIPSALLLLTRILRANCQSAEATDVALSSRHLLGSNDRNILIEGLYSAAEASDLPRTDELFQIIRRTFSEDILAYYSLFSVSLMSGKIQDASTIFKTWSDVDGESAHFYFAYGQLCLAAGDLDDAERALTQAGQMRAKDGAFQAALAMTLFKSDSKDLALDRARAAARADPVSPQAWFALSAITADPAEAARALAMAVDLRQNALDLSHLRICVHHNG